MTKLKPCPFCGGKAEYDNNDRGAEWIYCTECGATSSMKRIGTNEAIEAWNKRIEE